MYLTYNKGNSVVAERFIRTLKGKIYNYLRYLKKLVDQYNKSWHYSVGKKPIHADCFALSKEFESRHKACKFEVSDRVRIATQLANIGPQDVPKTSPSNFPWTSPKDPMTSRRRPNLTFKARPWEDVSGGLQDVSRASPRGLSKHSNLDVPKIFSIFLSELIWLTKSV